MDPRNTNGTSLQNDAQADTAEAIEGVNKAPLPSRHPAEVGGFVAALVLLLAGLGLEVSETTILAGVAVLGLLPAVITWGVNIWRSIRASL